MQLVNSGSTLVGQIIRTARLQNGFTQESLGKKIHMHPQMVSGVERGVMQMPLERSRRACEILGIRFADMSEALMNDYYSSKVYPTFHGQGGSNVKKAKAVSKKNTVKKSAKKVSAKNLSASKKKVSAKKSTVSANA